MVCVYVFFVFKQKTAYERRISDWSSDVCSSDLLEHVVDGVGRGRLRGQRAAVLAEPGLELDDQRPRALVAGGRAPLGRQTVDVALDLEQRVDALHRGDRPWRLLQVGEIGRAHG